MMQRLTNRQKFESMLTIAKNNYRRDMGYRSCYYDKKFGLDFEQQTDDRITSMYEFLLRLDINKIEIKLLDLGYASIKLYFPLGYDLDTKKASFLTLLLIIPVLAEDIAIMDNKNYIWAKIYADDKMIAYKEALMIDVVKWMLELYEQELKQRELK